MTKGAQGSILLDARRFLQGHSWRQGAALKNEQLTFAAEF